MCLEGVSSMTNLKEWAYKLVRFLKRASGTVWRWFVALRVSWCWLCTCLECSAWAYHAPYHNSPIHKLFWSSPSLGALEGQVVLNPEIERNWNSLLIFGHQLSRQCCFTSASGFIFTSKGFASLWAVRQCVTLQEMEITTDTMIKAFHMMASSGTTHALCVYCLLAVVACFLISVWVVFD